MEAVTGTATVVFTDLVDSTALRARLGEQAADVVRHDHDHALAEVVAGHRGRLVKSTGDGIVATFDAASDAVVAAVEMQQAVHSLARARRLDLAIRVGLSAGDVSWEDGDCFGLPVVEAARLEEQAQPGQILCAEIVQHLARGRAGVEFAPVGQLTVKGFDEPVAAADIAWSPATPSDGLPPCVGRERELALLRELWDRVRTGAGGVMLVAGEPGIGKTRLLTELADTVRAAGGMAWWGASFEGDARAYSPFTQLLDDAVQAVGVEALNSWAGSTVALIARVAPAMRTVLGIVDEPEPVAANIERERTEDAVMEFIATAASPTGLLVVIDDAHWADPSTVGLLRTLARRAARLPLLVVIAYRDIELDRRHPLADLLPGLRREPHVRRLVLSGLDTDGVAAVVSDLADQEPPPEVVEALVAETSGNPFFVREVALHLIDEGHLRAGADEWVGDPLDSLAIPEGIREVIGRRLSRLSADANRLLAVAAAFEAGFDLIDTAAVAGIDEDAALDAVEEALAARIVQTADGFDRYQFTHALFRHTLWAEWSPSRQVRLHRAIAEQLEKRHGGGAGQRALVLARHYHLSMALPGAERGVPYAMAAADDAATRFAADEEYQALSMALDLLPTGDGRSADLDARAARAAIVSGTRNDAAVNHARAAIEATAGRAGPVDAVRLAVELGLLADTAELNAGWTFGHLADPYRFAVDEATKQGVQLLAWDVEEAEFTNPANPGIAVDSPQRRRLNALADRLPPEDRPTAYIPPTALADYELRRSRGHDLWWAAGSLGHYREGAQDLRQETDRLLTSGLIGTGVFYLGMLGRCYVVLGELDRAAAVQAEGEAYLPRVEPESNNAAQFVALELFRQLLTGEDPASPLAIFDQVLTFADRPDLHWVSGPIRLGRAPLLAELGRHDEAIAALTDDMAVVEHGMQGESNLPMAIHWACRTAWLTESVHLADRLRRILHTKVIEPGFCYWESDSYWDAGLLAALGGSTDEARGWFQRSYDRLAEQEAVTLIPHVACDEALMEVRLGSAGDRGNGRRRLDLARETVERIGLTRLMDRIDRLAADLER